MTKKESFCSVGILSLAEGALSTELRDSGDVLANIIREQYPERVNPTAQSPEHVIVSFNDHDDTTFADVERVFEKAEVAWDERV